jgi:hypothetical protein
MMARASAIGANLSGQARAPSSWPGVVRPSTSSPLFARLARSGSSEYSRREFQQLRPGKTWMTGPHPAMTVLPRPMTAEGQVFAREHA